MQTCTRGRKHPPDTHTDRQTNSAPYKTAFRLFIYTPRGPFSMGAPGVCGCGRESVCVPHTVRSPIEHRTVQCPPARHTVCVRVCTPSRATKRAGPPTTDKKTERTQHPAEPPAAHAPPKKMHTVRSSGNSAPPARHGGPRTEPRRPCWLCEKPTKRPTQPKGVDGWGFVRPAIVCAQFVWEITCDPLSILSVRGGEWPYLPVSWVWLVRVRLWGTS